MVTARGFFPAVEQESEVRPLLDRFRSRAEAEIERHGNIAATVHAELRADGAPDRTVALRRFYWSTQHHDPTSAYGFAARTLHWAGDDAAGLQLHEFPDDPALTWLDQDDGPLRRGGEIERVDVLRYIPLRRLTFRLHGGAGLPASVIVKAKGTGGLNRAAVALLAVNRAAKRRAAVRVPALLRLEPPRHALYLEELAGEPLDRAASGLDLTEAMEQLGTLHRDLQALEPKGFSRRGAADWLEQSAQAAEQVSLLVPSAAGRVRALHERLERTAPDDVSPMFCQGDFLPGQVLCHPEGWSVIDFDDSHYADPLSEVAGMYVGMARELHLPAEQVELARRTYLEAYASRAGEPIDRDRWRWFLLLLQLTQLGKRLSKGRIAAGETESTLDLMESGEDGLD
ncbi:MAG TPA: aminoglycoside phosphotransferase family protein [Marmoricola sp.]|nr:aminoglycoside phosphotransferase family protein [Marmoricola sp.]